MRCAHFFSMYEDVHEWVCVRTVVLHAVGWRVLRVINCVELCVLYSIRSMCTCCVDGLTGEARDLHTACMP